NFSEWNSEQMNRVEAFAERIQARLKVVGVPRKLLFWGCGLTVLMPSEQEYLISSLQQCKNVIEDLKNSIETIANQFRVNILADRQKVLEIATMCHLVS